LNILLIGYGSIGKLHHKILSSFKKVNKVDVVTKQILENKTTYKNISYISNLNNYDYFIIANETYKHFEILKFIDKKVKEKIILVEKPLFKDYKKYKPNNKVVVAYNLRFHPIIHFLKKQNLIYLNAMVGQDLRQWRDTKYTQNYSARKEFGGGVLRDLSHEIDYVQYLAGNITTLKSIKDKKSNLKIDVEDIVVATGKTTHSIINFSMDYISKVPFRQIIAHTKNKTYICDLIQNKINGKTLKTIDKNYTYKKMHQDILNYNFKKACTYKEGIETMKIIKRVENE
jgi:predicted dehydrogenase